MTDITISALHAAYQAGMPIEEVLRTCREHLIAADDPGIFIHLVSQADIDAAVAALGPFDPLAKPLWGIPFAVKDNIDVAGMPTTAACPDFAYVPAEDAPVVARLKAAGAIVVGKTNLDQFATGLVGVRTPYPVPRNVLDPSLVPGGSSSGSAVATARGIVSFALGTDTAGSGRVPAALNGIVGLKPSLGALSTRGVVPACRTLDCVSVFATTVDDAWRVFEIAAAYDRADPYSRNRPARAAPTANTPVIGIPSPQSIRFFGDNVQQAAFDSAVAGIAAHGLTVRDIDFGPLYDVAGMLYDGAWVAERLAAIKDFADGHETALHPVTAKIILGARSLTAVDAFNGLYRLKALKRLAEALLEGIDMLVVPTIPTLYTLKDLEADPIGPNSRLGTYTNFANLMDLCGLAVPFGSRADGRPFGVTLLGRGGADHMLAEFGAKLLGETGRAKAGPPSVASAESDDIEFVVVGAHLSGMPLNKELTALGASFVRKSLTAPIYRLYALPTKPVEKPGLVRDGNGGGTAIETEVWRLAPAGFGRFVASIPSPLGIGTITLEDRSEVKGFLVEPYAIEGAEEISQFGGWRAYVARMR
ncbi:MAG: allophanate hydrolase [Alphaproteobacteria bacterium]|nr:allophanate hydrolase [Alphaproteobacteria bacterium]